jgi:adenine-specific DNA-methyltransferase
MQELYDAGRIVQTKPGTVPAQKRYLDEMPGVPLQSIWDDIRPVQSQALERADYPTQKPLALLDRLIRLTSDPGDIVLDCFSGSGTTCIASQQIGRRWIGSDINKGAIQTTTKRLQKILSEQAEALTKPQQNTLVSDEEEPSPSPCQLNFSTWRVNDYDLQIQHNEALDLACEYIGITRTRTDSFFDGTRGKRLVKVIPFNHPLTPLDLESIKEELARRPEEDRDIEVVALGMEVSARAWLENYNRNRPLNKLHLIELRTDAKYGGFIKHEPLEASVVIERTGDSLTVEVTDVFSPTIVKRLNLEQGLFRAQIDDWRAVVDCILIDTAYDGEVFTIALSDVPEKKSDLVQGQYTLPAPAKGSTVAVKIIDMLGEELIVSQTV